MSRCPEHIHGMHDPDARGKCMWCRRKVARPVPPPESYPESELGRAYRQHYDPDYGSGRDENANDL